MSSSKYTFLIQNQKLILARINSKYISRDSPLRDEYSDSIAGNSFRTRSLYCCSAPDTPALCFSHKGASARTEGLCSSSTWSATHQRYSLWEGSISCLSRFLFIFISPSSNPSQWSRYSGPLERVG
ncbi:hypothetical protein CDAR_273921 [Caerostris darwini]|uniref:Uncharacterized protein n=1 Tax=Caerostris darwini TaxID=1538125 RepID=A0AAV4RHG0_9ARAC|nr:hypothetical protein CDAR_273921 [Caerostris darwini]